MNDQDKREMLAELETADDDRQQELLLELIESERHRQGITHPLHALSRLAGWCNAESN